MRKLTIIETVWYLAFQDGPVDNTEYPTKEAADAALAQLCKQGWGSDICVMSRTREVAS